VATSNLKARIRRLETRTVAREKEGLTWPEFLHAFRAMSPELFKAEALRTNSREMLRTLEEKPPANIKELVRRLKRAAERDAALPEAERLVKPGEQS
jgi:hypothetical protein